VFSISSIRISCNSHFISRDFDDFAPFDRRDLHSLPNVRPLRKYFIFKISCDPHFIGRVFFMSLLPYMTGDLHSLSEAMLLGRIENIFKDFFLWEMFNKNRASPF
jgi:hypothetical protein